MSWSDLIPHIPRQYDDIEGLYFLIVLTFFKVFRAWSMQRRATYIDRFGWSIILFDYVFGVVFGLSLFYTLYPAFPSSVWVSRIVINALAVSAVWQTVEIYVSSEHRVKSVLEGNEPNGPPPSYDGENRRVASAPRRKEDRDMIARMHRLGG